MATGCKAKADAVPLHMANFAAQLPGYHHRLRPPCLMRGICQAIAVSLSLTMEMWYASHTFPGQLGELGGFYASLV